MRKTLLLCLVLCLVGPLVMKAQNEAGKHSGETENYRRSSLCLILLTHQGTRYAQEMEEQFLRMPLPERYNDHNVSIRVLHTRGKSSKSEVEYLLKKNGIAGQLVEKWFGYDPVTGQMNMQLVHDRGGYNASYADLQRVESTVRGRSALSEEGSELIQNTFVLVCDMDYYDKAKTGGIVSALLTAGALYFDAAAQVQARKGDATSAQNNQLASQLATAGAAVASNVGGFAVKMNAHLFRLKWNKKMEERMYGRYWVDSDTPASEAIRRKQAFDSDKRDFELDYIGSYRTRSEKTVFKNQHEMNMVIQAVCASTVNKAMNNLARNYPVFKPKTPFYCGNDGKLYAYIGLKEDVKRKNKFEVLETRRKKNKIDYKRVAVVKPYSIWDNRMVRMDRLEDPSSVKGTSFIRSKGEKDLCDKGYLLREMGKAGYQYKRHSFFVGAVSEEYKLKDKDMEKEYGPVGSQFGESTGNNWYMWRDVTGYSTESERAYGFELGWDVNFNTYIAWNVLSAKMLFGNSLAFGFDTGVTFRTKPLTSKGALSFFVQPSLGYLHFKSEYNFQYDLNLMMEILDDIRVNVEHKSEWKEATVSGFDWSVKAGVNLTRWLYLAYYMGNYSRNGISLGFSF